jgi:hypothetical protein
MEQRTPSKYSTASKEAAACKYTIQVELRTRFHCFTCPDGRCKSQAATAAAGGNLNGSAGSRQGDATKPQEDHSAAGAAADADEEAVEQLSPLHVQAVYQLLGSSIDAITKVGCGLAQQHLCTAACRK